MWQRTAIGGLARRAHSSLRDTAEQGVPRIRRMLAERAQVQHAGEFLGRSVHRTLSKPEHEDRVRTCDKQNKCLGCSYTPTSTAAVVDQQCQRGTPHSACRWQGLPRPSRCVWLWNSGGC